MHNPYKGESTRQVKGKYLKFYLVCAPDSLKIFGYQMRKVWLVQDSFSQQVLEQVNGLKLFVLLVPWLGSFSNGLSEDLNDLKCNQGNFLSTKFYLWISSQPI